MKYTFQTSFAFPLIKINSLITYTQVRKPTGISYFILVLLNEVKEKRTKLSELLIRFGVPKDLHEIFADEIQRLITQGIIGSDGNYNRDYFEEYKLDFFSFTAKGRKVFLDEAIPLESNDELKQIIYYNPALNTLSLIVDREYRGIASSIFDEAFCKKYDFNDEEQLESFINEKKSNGIKIKKEEVILKAQIQKLEYCYVTYPLSVIIENESIVLKCDDSKLQSFFDDEYNSEMISRRLLAKNKFKFIKGTTVKIDSKWIDDSMKLLSPEETRTELNLKSFLDISTDQYETTNCKLSFSDDSLKNVLKSEVFVKGLDIDNVFAYSPSEITFTNETFGSIAINLLVKRKLVKTEVESLTNILLNKFITFITDEKDSYSFSKLLKTGKFCNELSIVCKKIESWLSNDIDGNIVLLGQIRDLSTNEQVVFEYVKKKGIDMMVAQFKSINTTNLKTKLQISSWVIKSNKMTSVEVLNLLFENANLSTEKVDLRLFDLLEENGFNYEDILIHLPNVVKRLFSPNESKSKLADEVRLLLNTLNTLETITGIKDPLNYEIKDHIDHEKFMSTYKVFAESLKTSSSLSKYAKEDIDKISKFDRIFSRLNGIYTLEKNAYAKPSEITKKLIENKISNSDIMSALTYLYVKLTYIAKNDFGLKGDLIDMIEGLSLNKQDKAALHEFRKSRNDLEHANDNAKTLDTSKIYNVMEIIFNLKGDPK